jgi:hypothetical protein
LIFYLNSLDDHCIRIPDRRVIFPWKLLSYTKAALYDFNSVAGYGLFCRNYELASSRVMNSAQKHRADIDHTGAAPFEAGFKMRGKPLHAFAQRGKMHEKVHRNS